MRERAYLVGVLLPDSDADPHDPLGELARLTESAGGQVVGRALQRRHHVDPSTYIGHGKAEEIALSVKAVDAEVVIFDNDLSPAQIRELEKLVGCRVLDRSELILDIFAGRARTKAARLQVELAQLEYTFPRLTRMWGHLERLGGGGAGAAGGGGAGGGAGAGIGTRGPGEQQLEIDRRIVKKKITALRRGIDEVLRRKEREVESRAAGFTVGLVGYTNAGKSTLMNALTGAGTYAADQLFATLDTKTRKWAVSPGTTALLSDTVGFVRDLPHHLVASFRATLAEAATADLLLHVVDASHLRCEQQMSAVEQVLAEVFAAADDRPPPVRNGADRHEHTRRSARTTDEDRRNYAPGWQPAEGRNGQAGHAGHHDGPHARHEGTPHEPRSDPRHDSRMGERFGSRILTPEAVARPAAPLPTDWFGGRDVLLVFNKVDAVEDQGRLDGLRTLYPEAVCVSARTGRGLAELADAVFRRMKGERLLVDVSGPIADGRTLARLREFGRPVSEHYDDAEFHVRLEVGRRDVPAIERLNPHLVVTPVVG